MVRTEIARAALAEWLHMLDGVDASIAKALADANVQENADIEDDQAKSSASEGLMRLDKIDERFCGLRARLDGADRIAAAVEALLEEDERQSLCWFEFAEQARERLANRPSDYV